MPCIVNVTRYSGLVDKYSLGSVPSPNWEIKDVLAFYRTPIDVSYIRPIKPILYPR